MAEAGDHSIDIESGAHSGKINLQKTNRKGAGRYLPTGNYSGCHAAHIPKHR